MGKTPETPGTLVRRGSCGNVGALERMVRTVASVLVANVRVSWTIEIDFSDLAATTMPGMLMN